MRAQVAHFDRVDRGIRESVSSSAAAGARGADLVTVARGPLPQPTRGVALSNSSSFSQP